MGGDTITAAAAGASYQLDVGGSFIRNVCALTNACVSVNSDSMRKRGSNDGSANNFARIAEVNMEINDLKETWRHLVKLHKPSRNGIYHILRLSVRIGLIGGSDGFLSEGIVGL